jgi:hypothetical protein
MYCFKEKRETINKKKTAMSNLLKLMLVKRTTAKKMIDEIESGQLVIHFISVATARK